MEKKRLRDLVNDVYGLEPLVLDNYGINGLLSTGEKARVNIIALGDVGTNLLMGLKLLGGDVISEIGIYDLNEPQLKRLEIEFNQMHYPPIPESSMDEHRRAKCVREMPVIKIIGSDEELLDCDVLIFCATKSVPEIGAKGDMRMMQLEANLGLVKIFGEKIRKSRDNSNPDEGLRLPRFDGLVAVVSDPVDQLCKGMLESSGLKPGQVRGFGLGVMAARARYYTNKIACGDGELEIAGTKVNVSDNLKSAAALYPSEGRAFGPHGQDLVVANSVDNYDDDASKLLTGLTVEANLRVRDLGFKPFLAPAISSAALSIILTLRGEWNYGSVYFGIEGDGINNSTEDSCSNWKGAYVGVLSRLTERGVEYEDIELPEALYQRILNAYANLI